MIEFDGCMPAPVPDTGRLSSHPPPPYYHPHHHHVSHPPAHHPQSSSVNPHPRLNSLLNPTNKTPSDTSSSHRPIHHPNSHHPHPNGHHHPAAKKSVVSMDRPHPNGGQASNKKHAQTLSTLNQSIRMKQSLHHQKQQPHPPSHHGADSSRLPQLPSMVNHSAAAAAATAAPVVATKSSLLKISTANASSSSAPIAHRAPRPPPPPRDPSPEPESAAALKKKKKSHLSRDELSRVCHNGDVTFEAYNGSTYMIAIRSMGDRKSLIGYRCDWNACGYMNARVERMFGHIRSQHPDAPTVKKLITTTGPTGTTSTVTTTTSSGTGSASSSTSTTNSSSSSRLRSSSSLSNASSASSCPSPTPRSSSKSSNKCTTTPSASSSPPPPSASNSTLLSALSSKSRLISPEPVVKARKSSTSAPNKPVVASKSSPNTTTTSAANNTSLKTESEISTSPKHPFDAKQQPNPTETSQKIKAEESVVDKLEDLLNQTAESVHIKEDEIMGGDESHLHDDLMDIGLGEIKVEIHHSSPLMMEALSSNSAPGSSGSSHHQVDAAADFDPTDDKLSGLSSAELKESTERIMQELKTISSNYEQSPNPITGPEQQQSSGLQQFVPNPVDRNNNHQMGNVVVNNVPNGIVNECNDQSSSSSSSASSSAMVNSADAALSQHGSAACTSKMEPDPLDGLLDEDIESLLMDDVKPTPHSYHQPSSHDSYDHNFSLEQPTMEQSHHRQSPPHVVSNFQGQPQHHHTPSPPVGPHQQPSSMSQQSSQHLAMEHHSDQSNNNYDAYSSAAATSSQMNDYSAYDTLNNSNSGSNGSLEYSASASQQHHHHAHQQSSSSDHNMLYDGDGTSYSDIDPSLMLEDDGSNGSSSVGGVGKATGSRPSGGGKKSGSSKNYIGKQNLFQEFQSEEVAKVRDSENKYIIALQKNMKIVGYRCDWPDCEFLTCRKYVMVNHINGKHTNQRPFSCKLCQFNFVKRYFLKAHMNKVHKMKFSLDKDEDEDADIPPGSKREFEMMMDGYEDGCSGYEDEMSGIEGMPPTPTVPSVAPPVVVPTPVASSSKKAKSSNASHHALPNANYPTTSQQQQPQSTGYGYGPASSHHSDQFNGPYGGPACPPPDYSDAIPSTVQQFHSQPSYTSSKGANYGPPNDPMISGRGGGQMMNGSGYYQTDDSYGSDISPSAQTAAAAMVAQQGFKPNTNGGTVFMTPSPSSSIASPFSATGPATPNPKCGAAAYGSSMYDSSANSFECGVPQQSAMYSSAQASQSQQQQTPPHFLQRSYSQSNAPTPQQLYSANQPGPITKSHSVGSNPMLTSQSDLLTPPLSVSNVNGVTNCSGRNVCNASDMFTGNQQSSDPFFDSSMNGQSVSSGYSSANANFDDFLSPPSSISSSGSNFSGSYMNGVCDQAPVNVPQSVNPRQTQVCVPTLSAPPTNASMANASSFYLHTPSPSPSSLSHSPASAPVYPSNGGNSGPNGYQSVQSSAYSQQPQTSFNNSHFLDSMSSGQFSTSKPPPSYPSNGFISSQQQSLRQQQYANQQMYSNSSASSYSDSNCYGFEQDYCAQQQPQPQMMSNSMAASRSNKTGFYGGNGFTHQQHQQQQQASMNHYSASATQSSMYMDSYSNGPSMMSQQQTKQAMYGSGPTPFITNAGPAECWNAAGSW